MKPRFTDSVRFRLPYVSAQESAKSGYLEARFAQYRELQRAEAALRVGEGSLNTRNADKGEQEQLSAHPHEVLPLKARKR